MISVIVPTLNGAVRMPKLVGSLLRQTVKDVEVIVIDSESEDRTAGVAAGLGCAVYTIARGRFDHGGARNLGVQKASGEILVFLTQDAIPASQDFLARLTGPIDGRLTAAAYARQIPAEGATPLETFARLYNYPPESSMRHLSRIERRTLRTFFFSNSASAVSRNCFEKVGGFPAPVSTNEDMLLCARMLDAGYQVAYAAEAKVIHSHQFSMCELFQRYLRIGAVLTEYRDTLRSDGSSGEGMDFVRRQISYLRHAGRYEWVPNAIAEAAVKACGYYCGHALQRTRSLAQHKTVSQPSQ
ncbi:MAG: glycosyltransferase [Bryobacteraceae bacterium]